MKTTPLIIMATAALATGLAIPALARAQQNLLPPVIRNGQPLPEGYILLQQNISFSVALKEGGVEQQIGDLQKSFYNLTGSSCALVLQTIADECTITGITSNIDNSRMERPGQQAVVTVRGNIIMAIRLKKPQ